MVHECPWGKVELVVPIEFEESMDAAQRKFRMIYRADGTKEVVKNDADDKGQPGVIKIDCMCQGGGGDDVKCRLTRSSRNNDASWMVAVEEEEKLLAWCVVLIVLLKWYSNWYSKH